MSNRVTRPAPALRVASSARPVVFPFHVFPPAPVVLLLPLAWDSISANFFFVSGDGGFCSFLASFCISCVSFNISFESGSFSGLSCAQRNGAKSRQLITRRESRRVCGCITGKYQARSAPYDSNELTEVIEGLPAQNLLEQMMELLFRPSCFRAPFYTPVHPYASKKSSSQILR